MKEPNKEFKPTSWSIDNRTSIFIVTIIISIAGLFAYVKLPKESFPDIVVPTIYVQTIYPGTSPKDMENLVAKPLEKQIKAISGVKKLTANCIQDFTVLLVEFNTDVDVTDAKQKVKDAVDKAAIDLPKDLPRPPSVMEIAFSDIPIMYLNISGSIDLARLKNYADDLKDRIESMKEISRVDMVGALEREIQINVDMYKMQAAEISFYDIENAVRYENMTISGGTVSSDGIRRNISVIGEYKDATRLGDIIVKSGHGSPVYLKDIAEVKDSHKEAESFARMNGKNVITLNIIKRSGENLIETSDKINEIVKDMEKNVFPKGMEVVVTGDQSDRTRVTLDDLINTIIIGFILVTVVLMFFMGTTNALFVALSVPLSMFVAFLVMPGIGFTMNMIVLFSFLLALGIVVDDAIVVIENTHRIFENGKRDIVSAAKIAAGEVFIPVLSGTLTTLAPFIPLAFWQGIIGKFMFFLPVTLIITLLASLFVAYIINPVFAVQFMKPHDHTVKQKFTKGMRVGLLILLAVAGLFYAGGSFGIANFLVFMGILYLIERFFLQQVIHKFQTKSWPSFQDWYARKLAVALKHPVKILGGTIALFIVSVILFGIRTPKVDFFPTADPNFAYVYIALPVGTDQAYTDSVTKVIEEKVYKAIDYPNPVVSSVISNVAVGVSDPAENDQGTYSNKSKISVAFVKFAERNGESTAEYLKKIRSAVAGFPGAEITVDQEHGGPPVGKPINIEVSGEKFEDIIATADSLKRYLEEKQIAGVEELKTDMQRSKPEIVFDINRERANREGVSTAQIGSELRTAVFGKEVSKFRDENDEYPIQLRYKKEQRNNPEILKNAKLTYRDMAMGGRIRNVPLSSFAEIRYTNTFAGIKRKNQKRVVTIFSNVLTGYNANEVVQNVKVALRDFKGADGIQVKMTGQEEEQKETSGFLGSAMLVSLGLIFLILVTQFNSIGKPLIILSEILFSLIGVFLGFAIFNMNMSIVMTGVGIVALAGIVVRNGILIVEFTDLLREQGYELYDAILEAGRTRMTPVLLTATATILGLIPLAVGLNIDFAALFSEFNPHIHFGGDSVAFWGPLSWTMIFGLSFATFLTLVLVPVMYLLGVKVKRRFNRAVSGGTKPVEDKHRHAEPVA